MWFKNPLLTRLTALAAVIAVVILLRASGPGFEPQPPVQLETPVINWTQEELRRNPNVIVVLSEAFWDPTQIEGLKFSRDPIPTFRALQQKYSSGHMLSPQFGGGTANVEFEVLTGNSMRFLEPNTIAYETVVKHDVDSLASILTRQGYTSTSITPFHHWYFDSSNVYRHFGFSRYISLEFFDPNEYVGPYIGDHAVAKRIFEETGRSEGPDFIFANTMENHYHYWPNKFKRNTVNIKGNVSREALAILETYAQGASGADAMLQEVVEYYSQVKEPTIVVFFGDHLPHLEKDYYVYRESKYIQGEDDPDFLQKMYNVPLLVWNNYLPEGKDQLYMSPSFLGSYLLQLAEMKGTPYTDFLSKLSGRIPVIPPKSYYEAMNIHESDLTEYKEWQGRILTPPEAGVSGSGNFNENGDSTEALTQTFTLGYGEPVIRSVSPDPLPLQPMDKVVPDLLKTSVTVNGGRFGLGSVVFANGRPLQTAWQSEGSLTATVPKSLLVGQPVIELQVKIIDEHEKVLMESKPFLLLIQDKQP